ncbi:MAG: HAMP domain-containing sensor histidine kinase [Longimicrobiales bacterium]|nr:HAMP domain-containing sensor histidine kinase [Longimicrobiales bacterium]
MSFSLRQRILWWSVLNVLVILAVVFFLVDRSLRVTIRSGLEENVGSGARFAAELFRSDVSEGVEQIEGLASAPTLRAAVETGDSATVRANLEVLLADVEATWLAVTAPSGRLLAEAGPTPADRIRDSELFLVEARRYDTADLWVDGDGLTEVYAGPITLGTNTIGILLRGQRVGPEVIERLELATQQEILLVSGDRILVGGEDLPPQTGEVLSVALDAGSPAGADPSTEAQDGMGPSTPVQELELTAGPVLAAAVPIPGATQESVGRMVALRSLDEAMAPARQLRFTLLAVAGGGILLAFGFSFFLARSVTRPVRRLLRETVRLGSGDLEHPVEKQRDDELGRLAEGFDDMRRSLLDARNELVRAERLSAVGRAASAIVHDFSQPVNVIQGNVELLEYDWDDPEARDEDIRIIRRELRRLISMMQEILDFARGEDQIRKTTTSVPEMLDDIARRYKVQLEARSISLEVENGYDGTWSLDVPRTTRVIENLVRNAAGAIGSDGRVRLVSARRNGHLQIRVEDDGPGLPDGLGETLFEPFVTQGKEKGTGLGLAIAKSFTERQGGTIRFETSPEGTTFILTFPADQDSRGLSGRDSASDPADRAIDPAFDSATAS